MPAQTIQETLQSEFSPPLDTSLIAAIVADYVNESNGSLSQKQMKDLRGVLAELASQAEYDEDPLEDDFAQLQLSATDDSSAAADLFSTGSSGNTSRTSDVSNFSQQSLSSPLGFLQAVFPHLPVSRLKSALGSAEYIEEVDMESIVDEIMSAELVRELEERGLEEEVAPEGEWETAQPKKKPKRKAGKTITLVDIRQKQHIQASPTSPRADAPDPWTQLSSVAAHLESLLPSSSAAHFQSLFHSPNYTSPSQAVRAALTAMSPPSTSAEPVPEETQALFFILDVIRESADYASLPDVDRQRMLDDVQLALRATGGQPDSALEIVQLLRELDAGAVNWSVYHSPPPPSSPLAATMKSKHAARLPSGPPAASAPPKLRSRAATAACVPPPALPPPSAWKTIPVPLKKGPSPHADYIPAYNSVGKKAGSSSTMRNTLNTHQSRATEFEGKRREALREASRAWQRGNTGNRGGEIALYFAERAREYQEQARKENLDAAWDRVQSNRSSRQNGCTIDLHGTTVAEAVQICKDVLKEEPATPTHPLMIITGRGKHSANGVSVLSPAVKNALHEDGWNIGKWDGGLIVRGRSTRRV